MKRALSKENPELHPEEGVRIRFLLDRVEPAGAGAEEPETAAEETAVYNTEVFLPDALHGHTLRVPQSGRVDLSAFEDFIASHDEALRALRGFVRILQVNRRTSGTWPDAYFGGERCRPIRPYGAHEGAATRRVSRR